MDGQKEKKRRFALPKNGIIHSEDASKPYCHYSKTVSGFKWFSVLGLRRTAGSLF